MIRPRSSASTLIALMCCLAVAACGGDGDGEAGAAGASPSDEPIVIGAAVALSGLAQVVDEAPFRAVQLAVDDINAQGGVAGRKLELVHRDTKSDIPQVKSAAEAVLDEGAELLLTTCDFDFASPAAQAAQARGVINMTLCAESPRYGVQGIGPFAYSLGTVTLAQGAGIAEFADDKGWSNAFTLLDNTFSYPKEICSGFEDRWRELGGRLAGQASFKNPDTSIASQVSAMKRAQPDAIVMCSYPPGAITALKQIRAAGIDAPILSPGNIDGPIALEAAENLSDVYYPVYGSIYGDDTRAEVNDFVDRYSERFGGPPPNSYAIPGYSTVEAFARAAEQAGSTEAEAVADALNSFRDEKLLAGPTTFSEQAHVALARPLGYVEIQDGKQRFLGYREPAQPLTPAAVFGE